jgi:hypothetical protein
MASVPIINAAISASSVSRSTLPMISCTQVTMMIVSTAIDITCGRSAHELEWLRGDDKCDRFSLFCFLPCSVGIRQFFSKCSTCHEPVVDDERGGSVTVNDVEYHGECVTCFVCKTSLRGADQRVYTRVWGEGDDAVETTQILLCEDHQRYEPSPSPSPNPISSPNPIPIPATNRTVSVTTQPIAASGIEPCRHPPHSLAVPCIVSCAQPTAAGEVVQPTCPQCTKSLTRGARVQLSNGLQYHTACLYCATCRCPFPSAANTYSAFEILPTTNRIYCTKHVP